MDCDVLIVGAGPTGLTLAIDLGRRGVRAILVEQKERPAFLPKMERVNARTMEIYRRMGLAGKIRAACTIHRSSRRKPKRARPLTVRCRWSRIS
jgi:2-polyprenyl-6-methoxyphenol hydroxylase-like FAD-dependent oxidoreductase